MNRFFRAFLASVFFPFAGWCSAVTFVTALPVARDQIIVRFNFQPAFSTRQQFALQFPISVGYGLTSKLGLFANLSQGVTANDSASGRISNGGFGDMGLYARYTLFRIDRPNSSFRITPLAGAFLPTGNNSFTSLGVLQSRSLQLGSGTVDPYAGVSMGFTGKRWNAAADTTYRLNPLTSSHFSPGSELRVDGNIECKLAPLPMPEEGLPRLLNLSIESNYYINRRDFLNGVKSANSGGKSFRETATLQLSSLRWQVGGGVQIPLLQDLNGVGRIRQKIGYLVFFEYYLAAPVWRKKG